MVDINNSVLLQFGLYVNAITNTECMVILPTSYTGYYNAFVHKYTWHDERVTAESEITYKDLACFKFWSGSYNNPHKMWFTIGY